MGLTGSRATLKPLFFVTFGFRRCVVMVMVVPGLTLANVLGRAVFSRSRRRIRSAVWGLCVLKSCNEVIGLFSNVNVLFKLRTKRKYLLTAGMDMFKDTAIVKNAKRILRRRWSNCSIERASNPNIMKLIPDTRATM